MGYSIAGMCVSVSVCVYRVSWKLTEVSKDAGSGLFTLK